MNSHLRPIEEEKSVRVGGKSNSNQQPQLKSQVLRQHTLYHEQKQQLHSVGVGGPTGDVAIAVAAVAAPTTTTATAYIIDNIDDQRSVDSSTGGAYHVPIHNTNKIKSGAVIDATGGLLLMSDNSNSSVNGSVGGRYTVLSDVKADIDIDDDDDAEMNSNSGIVGGDDGGGVAVIDKNNTSTVVMHDDETESPLSNARSSKASTRRNKRKKRRIGTDTLTTSSKRIGRSSKRNGNRFNDDDSTAMDQNDSNSALLWMKHNIRLVIFLLVVLVVVIIAIVIVVVLTSGSSNDNQSPVLPPSSSSVPGQPSMTIPTTTNNNDDNNPSNPNAASPPNQQIDIIQYITKIVMDITTQTSSSSDNTTTNNYNVWNDPNSSQFLALQWILFQDQLPLRDTLLYETNMNTKMNTNDIGSSTIDRILQRYALVQLYFATNGPNWFVNSTDDDVIVFLNPKLSECNWTGVTCDRSMNQRRRQRQRQRQRQMKEQQQMITSMGGIVSSLQQQHQQPVYTNTYNVDSTFDIHRMMQSMDDSSSSNNNKVFRLFFPNMNLTGTIPQELGKCLPELYELDLSSNQLAGTIPDTLMEYSTVLYWIDLSNNKFIGTIPSNIWDLQELKFLFLYKNQLSGPIIRRRIDNETDATTSSLNNDDDSSSRNSTSMVGEKRSNLLKQIQLYDNFINGTIPLWLNELSDLEQFIVFENELTGPLPDPLPINMVHFDISFNNISGTIPNSYWSNDISSSSSSSIVTPYKIEKMYLDHNQLTGTLPNTTALRQQMQRLWINSNYGIVGTIPDGFGTTWETLVELQLHHTNLTGLLGPTNSTNSTLCKTIWPNITILKSNCLRRKSTEPPPVDCICCTLCEASNGGRRRRDRRLEN